METVNTNPIARYNHAIDCYNDSACMIEDIHLTRICCPKPISWIWDRLINIYLMTFFCQKIERGYCLYFLFSICYFALLYLPYISSVNLGLSVVLLFYYWAGVWVSIKNRKKLGKHRITEKMVPAM